MLDDVWPGSQAPSLPRLCGTPASGEARTDEDTPQLIISAASDTLSMESCPLLSACPGVWCQRKIWEISLSGWYAMHYNFICRLQKRANVVQSHKG